MPSAPIKLAEILDELSDAGQIGLVETATAITASRIVAASVRQIYEIANSNGFASEINDAAGELVQPNEVHEDFEPFVLTISKRPSTGVRQIVTKAGLIQALSEAREGSWQVARAGIAFATGAISISPWGHGEVFSPAIPVKSPRDIVRETNSPRLVPEDIRIWLLRGTIDDDLWRDPSFLVFSEFSTPFLIRSLASEIIGLDELSFNGPPRLIMNINESAPEEKLSYMAYVNIQSAAAWVYEDKQSTEQRHALFAAEFARTVTRHETILSAFLAVGRSVLDGARLAYQLSQSELSRDAIKAQGDLRKAISEDTSRAAEGTRTLAMAVAIAIATGVTLLASKSSGTGDPLVLAAISAIMGIYLVVVAAIGWVHFALQRELRKQWRQRFYRFVPDSDYSAMVSRPARDAELPYDFIGGVAVIVAFGLFILAYQILERPIPSSTTTANTRSSAPITSESLTRFSKPDDQITHPISKQKN